MILLQLLSITVRYGRRRLGDDDFVAVVNDDGSGHSDGQRRGRRRYGLVGVDGDGADGDVCSARTDLGAHVHVRCAVFLTVAVQLRDGHVHQEEAPGHGHCHILVHVPDH